MFIMYVIWALVPDTILRDMFSLTYLPDKYFAIFIPMLILVAVSFFAFFIYPGINLTLTPDINDVSTVRDSFAIFPCQWVSPDGRDDCNKPTKIDKNSWRIHKFCEKHEQGDDSSEDSTISDFCDCPEDKECLLRDTPTHLEGLRQKKQIPKVCDLPISAVCRTLYRD
uniref:PIG-P domain-containing protein n=3 Tax=Lutzomyia longipalpis TaxID=7200 RepID=A0A1B0C9Q9_LUTLO